MKKIITFSILTLNTLLLQAQPWSAIGCNETTNSHIAQTAATVSYSAVDANGTHYLAYIDDIGGPHNVTDFTIHVKKYNGTQWVNVGGAATPQFPSTDFFPIAVTGNDIYLAYTEPFGTGFDGKLSVKKFNPTNNQWEHVGVRGFSTGGANAVGIAAAGSRIYTAYTDETFNDKVSVRMFDSNNPGAGWQLLGSEGLSDGNVVQLPGSGVQVKLNGNNVYIAYIDISHNTAGGLVVKKFDGTSWTTVGGSLVSGTNPGYSSDIDFDNMGKIYVGYYEPNTQQALVKTIDGGSWVTVGGQAVANTITGPVSMVVVNNKPYIAYAPAAAVVNAEVKGFNAASGLWEFAGTNPATNLPATSDVIDLNLVASGNKLHLNFHTSSTGLYVKTWEAVALPLNLVSFTAAIKNSGAATLQWKTVNEVNTKTFEVQYAMASNVFNTIGNVKAKGNGTGDYDFITTTLQKGNHFFRLKMIDKDGSFSYSPVISVTAVTQQIDYYPNPAAASIRINTRGIVYNYATIIDLNGRIVKTAILNTANPVIDLAILPAGNYWIRLVNNNEQSTLPFIKK